MEFFHNFSHKRNQNYLENYLGLPSPYETVLQSIACAVSNSRRSVKIWKREECFEGRQWIIHKVSALQRI